MGEVVGFLDYDFFGIEFVGELFVELSIWVYFVEFDVIKGIVWDFLIVFFYFFNNGVQVSFFGQEDSDVVNFVYDFVEVCGFGFKVDVSFGDIYGVDILGFFGQFDFRQLLLSIELFVVFGGGSGGELVVVMVYDFVDDEYV